MCRYDTTLSPLTEVLAEAGILPVVQAVLLSSFSFIGEALIVLICFAPAFEFTLPSRSSHAETDDYAEIIDEEDTYTMPSSEYSELLQMNQSQH